MVAILLFWRLFVLLKVELYVLQELNEFNIFILRGVRFWFLVFKWLLINGGRVQPKPWGWDIYQIMVYFLAVFESIGPKSTIIIIWRVFWLLNRSRLESVDMIGPILIIGSLNVFIYSVFNTRDSHVTLCHIEVAFGLSRIVSAYWGAEECWISPVHSWCVLRRSLWYLRRAGDTWDHDARVFRPAPRPWSILRRILFDTPSFLAIFCLNPVMLRDQWLDFRIYPLLLVSFMVIDHYFLRLSASGKFPSLTRVPSNNPTSLRLISWSWAHHLLKLLLRVLAVLSLGVCPHHELTLAILWLVNIFIFVIGHNLLPFRDHSRRHCRHI